MLIGVPKEIKNNEYRVGLTPSNAQELISRGHKVIVEADAGHGVGFDDCHYIDVGAQISNDAASIYKSSDMIVKVKEPQPQECKLLKEDQVLFTYLHLAPDPMQTALLVQSGSVAIAYETVTDDFGGLPLLSPMSEVAGRMAIQAGAHCLEKSQGGSGMLLGGIPGVPAARVVVLGGGVVGTNSIRMAIGMEANVTVIDKSIKRLRELDFQFGSKLNTVFATKHNIEFYVAKSDLVIGAVLVPGAAAPKLVTKQMLSTMRRGSVLIDVSIDQGGCFETSRPTTHAEPTFVEDGIVHYCVANMPGGCARTATIGLNNATLPYIISLADNGYKKALLRDPNLLNGLNVMHGKITYKAVADALGRENDYVPASNMVGAAA
ncbi:MAG: alanine dehydrogenase [Gammaproteobacteria bacterium]|nr:alanine dehydrogenase [Gammaproteobacteria bacterium]